MPLLKFFKVIVDIQQKNMSLLIQCGLIEFLLTLPTQMNVIAEQLTVVVSTATVRADIEFKLMIQKNRFAILINPVTMSYTMFS